MYVCVDDVLIGDVRFRSRANVVVQGIFRDVQQNPPSLSSSLLAVVS